MSIHTALQNYRNNKLLPDDVKEDFQDIQQQEQQQEQQEDQAPQRNQHGVRQDIYRKHVHPAMAVLDTQEPKNRRPQAEAEKRKARLKLLGDAIRQSVQAVGASQGASVTPYDPSPALQSMQNYRQIMADQAEAESEYGLNRMNKYLESARRAQDEQAELDAERRDWERTKKEHKMERPFRETEMEQEQARIDIARDKEDRLQRRAQRDAIEFQRELDQMENEEEKAEWAEKNNVLLDPQDRSNVQFRLSDAERRKAEEMTLDLLTQAVQSGEIDDLDVRTAQLITRPSSISKADRWDLVQRWWPYFDETKQFMESGSEVGFDDPLNILEDKPTGEKEEEDPYAKYPDYEFDK